MEKSSLDPFVLFFPFSFVVSFTCKVVEWVSVMFYKFGSALMSMVLTYVRVQVCDYHEDVSNPWVDNIWDVRCVGSGLWCL